MAKVQMFFDYASPWAYLADCIRSRELPGVTVELCPIYLRGLPAFSAGLPYVAEKARYITQDLDRCAKYHGVPLRQPTVFPIDGLHALRGALWCQEHGGLDAYHQAVFKAAWRDDRPIADRSVLVELAGECGLDRQAFAAGIESPAIKATLRARTADALERGVFGVPTFFAGDEMFWGHDRLDYVARALAAL